MRNHSLYTTSFHHSFGMSMEGYKNAEFSYSYGFGGQYMDSEIAGEENSYAFEYRDYDPRIIRFKSRDPKAGKFPWWTPYQYAGNRPIDGIDLEGAEYITYTVRIVDGKAPVIIDVCDYRDIEGFNYEKYSESFGPEGRGVKYIYQFENANGEIYDEVEMMEISQGGGLSRSAIGRHGFFQGSGAKTIFGPHEKVESYHSYDWAIDPIDEVDAIAYAHDRDQEDLGTFCWLEDVRTLPGDKAAIEGWDAYYNRVTEKKHKRGIDNITGKPASDEAINSAFSASMFFGMLVRYKEWKISEMERLGLDVNNPEHMRDPRVMIDSYKGKWYEFKRNYEQKILKSAIEDTPQ